MQVQIRTRIKGGFIGLLTLVLVLSKDLILGWVGEFIMDAFPESPWRYISLDFPYYLAVVTVFIFSVMAIMGWGFKKNVYLTSPYFRREQDKQPEDPETIDTDEKPWRIPLNEFCKYAHQNGWALYGKEGTAQFFDLINGLNQAALDGVVDMWGKEGYREHLVADTNPLLQLPKDYWLEYKIDPFTCISTDKGISKGIVKDNNDIRTERRKDRFHKNMHSDIHVRRNQAEQWFKQDAPAFKGRSAAVINEEFPECP